MERLKRILAMLLSAIMIISCIPASAISVFAADDTELIETFADEVPTDEESAPDVTGSETEPDTVYDTQTNEEFVQNDAGYYVEEIADDPNVESNYVQGQDGTFSVTFTGVPEGTWIGVVSESMEEGYSYTEDDLLDYSNLTSGSYLYGVISGEELIFWSRFTIDDTDLVIQVDAAMESVGNSHKAPLLRGSQYYDIGMVPDGITSIQTNNPDCWTSSDGTWTVKNTSKETIPLLKIVADKSGLLLINYSTNTQEYDNGCSEVGTVLLYKTNQEITAKNYSGADNIDKKSDYSGSHENRQIIIPVSAGDTVYFTLYAFSNSDIEQTASISGIQIDDNAYEAHNGRVFGNLTDLLSSAGDGDVIALLDDVTVRSDLTIPQGVTLLIPFNSSETLCTTEPSETNSYQKPKQAYRTLTLDEGANLVVEGSISISAKVGAVGQTGGHNAAPSGDYGAIELKDNSSIEVANNGKLYAWGYVYGDGTVEAQNGATIYECFQLKDWRGGSHTSRIVKSVFPFVQYYVQNIEVPLTFYPGANEVAYTTNSVASAAIDFIGDQGMFKITSGSLTKQYDSIDDRLIVDVNGDFEVSPITFTVYVNIDTSEYVLPWTYNMTFNINKGKTTVNQDMLLLPGTKLTIAKDAEVDISEGHYVYAVSKADAAKAEEEINSALTLFPVDYSVAPIVNNRSIDKLQDASINLEGKIKVDGGLYVSETWGSTNLKADEGAEICFIQADETKDSVIYAGSKNTIGTNVNTIAVEPVYKLLDNTTGTTAGDIFIYRNKKWSKNNSTEKASLSITSGDTTATAKVYDDYHAEFILPAGNVNLSTATVEVALTDVASLGISGTRSHTIEIATGLDDENVALDADLMRRLIPGLLEFQGADVIARIGENSAQYELKDQSSTTEKAVIATVDEDAARTVWHEIVNNENFLISTQTPGDSYSIITKGSYIMLGNEMLVFEDNVDNLVLDDFGKIEENIQAVRDHMKLVNSGNGNVIFLKAGTILALDSSVATLKKDLTITMTGDTISFGSAPLATLRDETEKKQIVKDVLKMFGTFLGSINGKTIEVEFEFNDVVLSSKEKASLSITSGDTTATAKVFDDYHAEFILPAGNVNLSKTNVEVSLTDVASLGINGTRSHTIGIATGLDDENVVLDADLIRRLIPGLLEFQNAKVNAKIGNHTAQYDLTDHSSATEKAVIATVDEDAARAVWHAIVNSDNIFVSTQTSGDSFSIITKDSYIMLGNEKLVFEDNVGNLVLDDFGQIEANIQAVRGHMKLVNEGSGNVIFLKAGTTLALDSSVATLKRDLTITLTGDSISFGSKPLATLRAETEKKQIVKDVLKMFGSFLGSINGKTIDVEFAFGETEVIKPEVGSNVIGMSEITDSAKCLVLTENEGVKKASKVTVKTEATAIATPSLNDFDTNYLESIVSNAIGSTADVNELVIRIEGSTVSSNLAAEKPTITYEVHPEAVAKVNGEIVGEPYRINDDHLSEGAIFTLKLTVPGEIYQKATPNENDKRYVAVTNDSNDLGTYEIKTDNESNAAYYIECAVGKFGQFELEPVMEEVTGSANINVTLALEDSIDINFYVSNLKSGTSANNYKVTYSFGDGNVTSKTLEEIGDIGTSGIEGTYKLVVAKCAAKEMTVPVNFKLEYTGNEDSIILFETATYSVQTYCLNKINNNSSEPELVNLCKAVLDYGTAAQYYFDYRTNELANGGTYYTEPGNINVPEHNPIANLSNDVKKLSISVSLESMTELNFYVGGPDLSVENVTNGTKPVDYTIESISNTSCMVKVKGIAAKELNDDYTLTFTTQGGNNTVTYSPMTFAYRNRNSKSEEYLSDVSRQLYNYYHAAFDYFN